MTERFHEHSTWTGSPLTLGDLRAFLAGCEQMAMADTAVIRASVSIGGKLKKLTARTDAPRVQVEHS